MSKATYQVGTNARQVFHNWDVILTQMFSGTNPTDVKANSLAMHLL